ncbi:MAG: sigma-70 family RNA polymerase sigma factor, partial [Verrucomicrobiota bacterium]|nr:sigma-70 family RNA polymerase sigma factor [Verrucomicrobiota bacterium]
GRLRSYLLVPLKHFLANERHRARAIKRGEGRPLLSLEELQAEERADLEPTDPLSADKIYERDALVADAQPVTHRRCQI